MTENQTIKDRLKAIIAYYNLVMVLTPSLIFILTSTEIRLM